MEKIIYVWFEDGRIYMLSDHEKVYSRPLEAFPTLKEATDKQRSQFTIELDGEALRWKELDEDIHISSFYETEEPQELNEVAQMFHSCPWLNVSEVARALGIHKSLLSKYIYGMKKPSEQRKEQIRSTLRAMGEQMMAV